MQARAILEATAELTKADISVFPEIMIPLVGTVTEYTDQEAIVRTVAKKVEEETGVTLDYLVGTMIELPRACLTADEIAQHADFSALAPMISPKPPTVLVGMILVLFSRIIWTEKLCPAIHSKV